jgi:beta-N-acetylhexosaminidase
MSRLRARPAARGAPARGPLATLGGVLLVALSLTACGQDEGTGGLAAASAAFPTAQPTTPPSCAQQTLDRLDLPSRAGQLLMVGVPAGTLRADVTSWAGQLRAAGITMDLAPVADTVPAGTGKANPPIGASDRQYGSDPARVATAVGTVVRALQDAGVGATAKHFPGLGRVRLDTDTDVGATDPETNATDPYLQPFAAAVDAGTATVMVSSATYPQLDPGRLAVFSPAVLGLLRDQLRFDGVVVTDDLGQAVELSDVPVGQRAVDAVTAGVDLVLTVRTADAAPMSGALADRATADSAFAARVDGSALRVLALKERFGLLTC